MTYKRKALEVTCPGRKRGSEGSYVLFQMNFDQHGREFSELEILFMMILLRISRDQSPGYKGDSGSQIS